MYNVLEHPLVVQELIYYTCVYTQQSSQWHKTRPLNSTARKNYAKSTSYGAEGRSMDPTLPLSLFSESFCMIVRAGL